MLVRGALVIAAGGLLCAAHSGFQSKAYAQETRPAVTNQNDEVPLRLRGTMGSGEQETVFAGTEPIGQDEAAVEPALPVRDTSDPVRQLQGRATPVQPEPPVADPLLNQ